MSVYSDQVIADGASHYWRLGEPSGTTAADTVGTAHGTISGGVTLGVPGAGATGGGVDTAVTFNGTSGKITTGAFALVTPFTIEFWARRNSNAANQVILCNTWGAGDNLVFFVQPGRLDTYTGAQGSPFMSWPYDTNWHHIVLVCESGAAGTLYIDAVTTPSDPTPITFTAGVAKPFVFAFDPNWSYYNGSLDDVAVYPGPATPAQILNHYRIGASQLVTAATRGSTAVLTAPSVTTLTALTAATLGSTVMLRSPALAYGLTAQYLGSTAMLYEPAVYRTVPGGRPFPGVIASVGTYVPAIDMVGSYEG